METIGHILKTAREKKGLTIQDLEANTHIMARYIEALENEQFDKLPGDIYIKGFIKNISDKLSLNSDEVLETYKLQKTGMLNQPEQALLKNKSVRIREKRQKNKTETQNNIDNTSKEIQKEINDEKETSKAKDIEKIKAKEIEREKEREAKVIRELQQNTKDLYPAETALLMLSRKDLPQLKKRRVRMLPIIVGIFAIVIITLLIFFQRENIANLFSSKGALNRKNPVIARNIVDSIAKQNVKVGDTIYFKPLGISATIKFNGIGNIVHVNINGQDLSFSKSSPIILDLNGNGINDFRISLMEVYDDLATVEMERLEENQMINSSMTNVDNANQETTNVSAAYEANGSLNDTFPVINGETYIETDVEKAPIFVEITARHFVYVRYFIDSDRPSTTNLLSGKTLSLEARDVIMLTIGNAGEVIVKINGKIVNVGEPGETVNKTIKWVKNLDDSTRYNLIISDTK